MSLFTKESAFFKGLRDSLNFRPGGRILRSAHVLSSDSTGSFPHKFPNRLLVGLFLIHALILTYLVGLKQGELRAFDRAERVFKHVYTEFVTDLDHRDDIDLALISYITVLRDISYDQAIERSNP
jgi:hypothetical protein